MSNFHAIATVTAALEHILQDISNDVAGAKVTTLPLDEDDPADNRLNIFLYRVIPNNNFHAEDMPTYDSAGNLFNQPALAINLRYVLTAFTKDTLLLEQKVLASALRIMHENPILTKTKINDIVGLVPKVAGSDLAEQIEHVKFTLVPESESDINSLWTTFSDTNYRISVVYQADVVLLDSKASTTLSLPVKDYNVRVFPSNPPVIQKIEPQMIESSEDIEIEIVGYNLKSDKIIIDIDSQKIIPEPSKINEKSITVKIPNDMSAGIKPVKIIHEAEMESSQFRKFAESNTAVFLLAPKIILATPIIIALGDDLSLDFRPPIKSDQKVEIIIGNKSITIPKRNSSVPITTMDITISDDFIDPGEYLLRLRVDGIESYLQVDEDTTSADHGKFIAPKVVII